MASFSLCENCNADGTLGVVEITDREDGSPYGPTRFTILCAECRWAVRTLDFAKFISRREHRPRRMELP